MKKVKFEIKGVTDLIMHNGRLANPLDKYAREMKRVSGRTKKSDADYEAMAKIEFVGGCYYSEAEGFYLPELCIEAGIKTAAVAHKRGIKKMIESAVMADGNGRLTFDGPKTPEERVEDPLLMDQRLVAVKQSRVVRTRPVFRNWACSFVLQYDDSKVNRATLVEIVETWGNTIGCLELRPKYGRFNVISAKDVK